MGGNIWVNLAAGGLGFVLLNLGIAILLGLRLPRQERLAVPPSLVGAVLLAAGTGLVTFFGQPDLVERVVQALAGS